MTIEFRYLWTEKSDSSFLMFRYFHYMYVLVNPCLVPGVPRVLVVLHTHLPGQVHQHGHRLGQDEVSVHEHWGWILTNSGVLVSPRPTLTLTTLWGLWAAQQNMVTARARWENMSAVSSLMI